MSSGILPQAGYIFQDKVVIFVLLARLADKNIKECSIELELNDRTDINDPNTYNLDFDIITVNPERHEYYEVKDKKSLSNQDVRHILESFYEFYLKDKSPNNTKFLLLHSKVEPSRRSNYWIFQPENIEKDKEFCKILGNKSKVKAFVSTVHGYTIAEVQDPFVSTSDLILRSYALIDKIIGEFLGNSSYSYGDVKKIYDAMIGEYRNSISFKAKTLKKAGTQTAKPELEGKKDKTRISIQELLQTKNGIIEVIFDRLKKKGGKRSLRRSEIIEDFNRIYLQTIKVEKT